jgi:2-polyprenyl-6-hydroxyphenyl methylase/3-demethylubiquinone-9 3-methyltransferase
MESLVNFTGFNTFKGKTFVDIGCGSGLFSLAAYKLGAKKIISLDVDTESVACCRKLFKREGKPSNWEVITGDVLSKEEMSRLGKFDIVYSWGVLHHTGNMWKGIANSCDLVKENGIFYLAIYNKADGLCLYPDGRPFNSKFWLRFKKWFVTRPEVLQDLITYLLAFFQILSYVVRFKNPMHEVKKHTDDFRGMSWLIDIKDWLGGYPYEFASVSEIFSFMKTKDFKLENLKDNNGLLNNEYLFRKNQ